MLRKKICKDGNSVIKAILGWSRCHEDRCISGSGMESLGSRAGFCTRGSRAGLVPLVGNSCLSCLGSAVPAAVPALWASGGAALGLPLTVDGPRSTS